MSTVYGKFYCCSRGEEWVSKVKMEGDFTGDSKHRVTALLMYRAYFGHDEELDFSISDDLFFQHSAEQATPDGEQLLVVMDDEIVGAVGTSQSEVEDAYNEVAEQNKVDEW